MDTIEGSNGEYGITKKGYEIGIPVNQHRQNLLRKYKNATYELKFMHFVYRLY
jgi:hypothetical protein